MTIDEAIEIKESPKYGTTWPTPPKEREADNLSIKALKRVKELRISRHFHPMEPLPGETEG